jgi:hypothetical protein
MAKSALADRESQPFFQLVKFRQKEKKKKKSKFEKEVILEVFSRQK